MDWKKSTSLLQGNLIVGFGTPMPQFPAWDFHNSQTSISISKTSPWQGLN